MELYTSNLLFLSEALKAVRTSSSLEVHTKSLSCDQMNTCSLWAPWCILATRTQELVSVSYRFRKVHTGPCGRTGLATPTWSICRVVRRQQAFCMRPVRFRMRSIGSARLSRLQSMRNLHFRSRAIADGSKVVQNIVRARTAYLAITQWFSTWFSCDRGILTAMTRLMSPSNSRTGGGTSPDATMSIGPSLCSVTSNGMLVLANWSRTWR